MVLLCLVGSPGSCSTCQMESSKMVEKLLQKKQKTQIGSWPTPESVYLSAFLTCRPNNDRFGEALYHDQHGSRWCTNFYDKDVIECIVYRAYGPMVDKSWPIAAIVYKMGCKLLLVWISDPQNVWYQVLTRSDDAQTQRVSRVHHRIQPIVILGFYETWLITCDQPNFFFFRISVPTISESLSNWIATTHPLFGIIDDALDLDTVPTGMRPSIWCFCPIPSPRPSSRGDFGAIVTSPNEWRWNCCRIHLAWRSIWIGSVCQGPS